MWLLVLLSNVLLAISICIISMLTCCKKKNPDDKNLKSATAPQSKRKLEVEQDSGDSSHRGTQAHSQTTSLRDTVKASIAPVMQDFFGALVSNKPRDPSSKQPQPKSESNKQARTSSCDHTADFRWQPVPKTNVDDLDTLRYVDPIPDVF